MLCRLLYLTRKWDVDILAGSVESNYSNNAMNHFQEHSK
jgi:hypothetical protein